MSNSTASLGLKIGGEAPKLPQPVPAVGSPGWVASDPSVAPPIWPNRLDGDYRVNGVVQTQLPHMLTPGNVIPPSGSYFWASIR